MFEPDRLEETCRKLAEAQPPSIEDEARLGANHEAPAGCDARLARYRQALEAGTDPAVVASWIRDLQASAGASSMSFVGTALRPSGPPRTSGPWSRAWEIS